MNKKKWFIYAINILLKIWSHSPILALTDDRNFLDIQLNDEGKLRDNCRLRFSIVNLSYGIKCVRFISFGFKPYEFDLISTCSLADVLEKGYQNNDIDAKRLEYKKHYEELDPNARAIEKESLLRHLADEEKRVGIADSKVNIFSSIVLMILAVVVPVTVAAELQVKTTFLKLLLLIEVFVIWNLCWLIFQTFSVNSCLKMSFSDLKKVPDTEKDSEYSSQIYYDWQQTGRKAQLHVSYLLQFQEWIIFGVITAFLIVAGIAITQNRTCENAREDGTVYTINMDRIDDTYSSDSISWLEVQMELQKESYNKIIILYKQNSDIALVKDVFEYYERQEIKYIEDKRMHDREIKIVMED